MLREEFGLAPELKETIRDNTARFLRNAVADGTVIPWAAVSGTELAGMCVINLFLLPPNDWCPGGRTAYLGNMYVKPEFRRRGIASALLDRAVSEAKSLGCERILLHSSEEGRRIYEKCGFEPSETAMALYPERKNGM